MVLNLLYYSSRGSVLICLFNFYLSPHNQIGHRGWSPGADFLPTVERNEGKKFGLFKKILKLAAKWCRQIGGICWQLSGMTG
jgi:hypothetical protein